MWKDMKLRLNEIKSWNDRELADYWISALREKYPFNIGGEDAYLVYLSMLPPVLGDAYLAFLVWAEVGNGGFEQYFFNKGTILAQLAVGALERIGCRESSCIMKRAISAQQACEYQTQEKQQEASRLLEQDEKAEAWDAFASLYDAGTFASLNDAYDHLDREHNSCWLNHVRQHLDYLVPGA
jgi:hypothetical protein